MADHPIPWRWWIGDDGLDNALLDARGARVLSTLEGYVFGEGGEDYLRELFRVAPEMEAALRSLDAQVEDGDVGALENRFAAFDATRLALLARLDAARRNG